MPVVGESAGTITKGQRALSAVGSTRRRPQILESIQNISADLTPLIALIESQGNSKVVGQAKYTHMETDMLPTVVSVDGSSYNSVVTTVNVAAGHGNRLTPGDILLVIRTDEMLRVTAVSTDALTVTRGFASTTAATINANEEMQIFSHANTDGNTSPDAKSSEPTLIDNYCQIFRQAVEATRRNMNSDNYGGDEWARISKDAFDALQLLKEKTFLFSNNLASSDPYFTGGVRKWVSTNVTNVAGVLTESSLITNFILPLTRRNHADRTGKLLCFAGENVCNALDGFGRDAIRYSPDDEMLGIKCAQYQTFHGSVKIAKHGLMTPNATANTAASKGWLGYLMGLQMKCVGSRYYKGSKNLYRKNIHQPDKDGRKDEWLTDEGFWMCSEIRHAYMYGITG